LYGSQTWTVHFATVGVIDMTVPVMSKTSFGSVRRDSVCFQRFMRILLWRTRSRFGGTEK
jgi:hypothetical protein